MDTYFILFLNRKKE